MYSHEISVLLFILKNLKQKICILLALLMHKSSLFIQKESRWSLLEMEVDTFPLIYQIIWGTTIKLL